MFLAHPRRLLTWVNNYWSATGTQVLLGKYPPDPLWEHLDLCTQIWQHLQQRSHAVRAEKANGHLEDEDLQVGLGGESEHIGNDGTDALAKK